MFALGVTTINQKILQISSQLRGGNLFLMVRLKALYGIRVNGVRWSIPLWEYGGAMLPPLPFGRKHYGKVPPENHLSVARVWKKPQQPQAALPRSPDNKTVELSTPWCIRTSWNGCRKSPWKSWGFQRQRVVLPALSTELAPIESQDIAYK